MDLKDKVYNEALYSALKNKGEVRPGTLMGVMLKENPGLKGSIADLKGVIDEVCASLSGKTYDDIVAEAKAAGVHYEEPEHKRKEMVELKVKGAFRTRMPPEPSKHLHAGHAISFLLNHIYAEKYGGSVVLRFEDTNPSLSKQEYVDSITEDILVYLQIKPSAITYASDSMKEFYDNAGMLIGKGSAYVCTCDREKMASLRNKGEGCECRRAGAENNNSNWSKMLGGSYEQGQAVLRLKGDMNSNNMVMRDPVLFRIVKEPHYRHGSKYSVWPVYDFENSLLDASEGITHVLRSNEFGTMREELQQHIRSLLGLEQPEIIQYGRFEVEGANTKGRELREAISQGLYSGWDDPRMFTLKALRRKGISHLALIEIAKEVGLSPTPTRIDRKMIATFNRRIIDNDSDRFSFVYDPVRICLEGVAGKALLPLHPQIPEKGGRELIVDEKMLIRQDDFHEGIIRLADFANIDIENEKVVLLNKTIESFREAGGKKIINWLPDDPEQIMRCSVLMDDASIKEGLIERNIKAKREGDMVQLERFGFCRIESIDEDEIRLIFAHK
jgi:glutamyl-tRNA synthetase